MLKKNIDGIFKAKRADNFGIPIPIVLNKHSQTSDQVANNTRRSFFSFSKWLIFLLIFSVSVLTFVPLVKNKTLADSASLYQLYQDGNYLILFQNSDELRPTGGFIGSFGLLKIKDKKVANFQIETNIYQKDDTFTKNYYIPQPDVIEEWRPNNSWNLRDSNWKADFSEASQDIKWFFESQYNQSIDGIIAINSNLLPEILRITGPIESEEYGTLNADNILTQVQTEVEENYYKSAEGLKENQPKMIIAKIFPDIATQAKSKKIQTAKLFLSALDKKNILFYFNDQREKLVNSENWGGAIVQTADNFLYINNANLGGGKSSRQVAQNVQYTLNQNNLNLKIERTLSNRSDNFPIDRNANYTRVFLPMGAKLDSATLAGEDIAKSVKQEIDGGKNSFGFWFITNPNQTKSLEMNFVLPSGYDDLYLQKQPGATGEKYKIDINGEKVFEGGLEKDMGINY